MRFQNLLDKGAVLFPAGLHNPGLDKNDLHQRVTALRLPLLISTFRGHSWGIGLMSALKIPNFTLNFRKISHLAPCGNLAVTPLVVRFRQEV